MLTSPAAPTPSPASAGSSRCALAGRRPNTSTSQFEANPILLDEIGKEMAQLVPPGTEVLAGLEMVCVIDRQAGGREALVQAGLDLSTVFTRADLEAV